MKTTTLPLDRGVDSDIPPHWKVVDFWTVASQVSRTNCPDAPLLSVFLDRGVIPYAEGGGQVHKPSESLDKYQLVEPGDLVLNNQQAWRGSVGVSKHSGIVSPAYLVFQLSTALSADYAHYQFRDRRFVDEMMLASQGVGDIQRQIKRPLLRKAKVLLPPLAEQKAIAAFIDRSVARIDGLITKKARFIELLCEKRQALITHAVTRGLDPTAPVRDSGVDWIARMPVTWQIMPSRRMFRERNERAKNEDTQLTVSQKYGLIPQDEFMRKEGRRVVVVQKGHNILKRVHPGDFVISMRSFQGGLEYSERYGSMSSAYVALTPIKPVEPRYFRWLFKSSGYIQALQSTSDLVRDGQALRFENFSKVPLPVPPPAEQREIGVFLDQSTARIDTLIDKTERSIELLQERRTALISAAVSGKIGARAEQGTKVTT